VPNRNRRRGSILEPEPTRVLVQVKLRKATRFSKDQLRAVLIMFARGYTAAKIRKFFREEYQLEITDQKILELAIAYDRDVVSYREELNRRALKQGVIKTSERVARLNEIIEAWEDRAKVDPKAAGIYIRAIGSVREEAVEAGRTGLLPEDDPWGQLLIKLKSAGKAHSQLEAGAGINTGAGSSTGTGTEGDD